MKKSLQYGPANANQDTRLTYNVHAWAKGFVMKKLEHVLISSRTGRRRCGSAPNLQKNMHLLMLHRLDAYI